MKVRSAVLLVLILALIAGAGYLTVNEVRFGNYKTVPLVSKISLGLDLRGGVAVVYQAEDDGEGEFAQRLERTMSVLQARLAAAGYTEATVVAQGTDRIRVEIPDVDDPEQVIGIIGSPGHLEFLDPDGNVIMEGSHIKTAEPAISPETGAYVVSFTLDSEGAKAFAEATSKLVGKTIDITLDGESLFGTNPPTVQSAITGGQGQITGNYTVQSAKTLAALIQSGALPLDIEQIEVRTVSATLGESALSGAILAGFIGVALVMLFMIVMYRLPGLMSAVALAIYILLDIVCLALVGAQLTLPGIAGIILSIGMAVDANVIIFERIKEELNAGKMLRPSINSGFRRAFSAILDSNVTTIIAALVLGIFGTGTIKGFAITLGVGVALSLFTAVTVTRWLLHLALGLNATNKRLYGMKKLEEAQAK